MKLETITKNIRILTVLGKRSGEFDTIVNSTIYGALEHLLTHKNITPLQGLLNTLVGVAIDSKEKVITQQLVVALCDVIGEFIPRPISYKVGESNPVRIGGTKRNANVKPLAENIDFLSLAKGWLSKPVPQPIADVDVEPTKPAKPTVTKVEGTLPQPKPRAAAKTPAEKAAVFEQSMLNHIDTMSPSDLWAMVEQRLLGAGNIKFLEGMQESIQKEIQARKAPAKAGLKAA